MNNIFPPYAKFRRKVNNPKQNFSFFLLLFFFCLKCQHKCFPHPVLCRKNTALHLNAKPKRNVRVLLIACCCAWWIFEGIMK